MDTLQTPGRESGDFYGAKINRARLAPVKQRTRAPLGTRVFMEQKITGQRR